MYHRILNHINSLHVFVYYFSKILFLILSFHLHLGHSNVFFQLIIRKFSKPKQIRNLSLLNP